MKKNSSIILSALLSTTVFVACTERIEDTIVPGKTRTIEVRVETEINDENTNGAVSKATWQDGKGLHWATGEAAVFGLADNKGSNNNAESFTLGTDGTASFTGSVAETASKFLPYYPKVGAAVGNDGDLTINFPIASIQTQTEAGKVDVSADKIALTGVSPIDLGAKTSYSAAMTMQSSMVRFIIYSSKGSTDAVKSVSLTTSENAKISGLWVVVQPWNGESRAFIAGDQKSSVTVNLGTAYNLEGVTGKDDASGIYMGVCPAKTTGCTYVVTTDKGTYSFESSKEKEFKAGTIHNIALNLDKGVFQSTAEDVVFYHNGSDSYAPQNVDSNQHILYLDATTATYGGEPVTMTPEDCVLVSVNPAKNKSTSERSCKVYMEYKGIRSRNFISIHQDPGNGLPVIVPTLTPSFEGEISYTGETVEAATLELKVDGAAVSGATVDSYVADSKYGISISCGGAAAVCKEGIVSITVPENSSSRTKSFKLIVKTEDGSAESSFTQAANPAGETETHTFEYVVRADYPENIKPGLENAAKSWPLYHFSNIKIDGTAYPAGTMKNIPEDLQNALIEHALKLADLEKEDIGNQVGPQYTAEEMKTFVSFTPVVDDGAEMHVNVNLTANTTGQFRNFKIISYNSDGSIYRTNKYFQVQ